MVANGDIDSPQKAARVLAATGADALMIGRAAMGRPWLFREIGHFLQTGAELPSPAVAEVRNALLRHLNDHYRLYGEYTGVRNARKHINWYVASLPGGSLLRQRVNTMESATEQTQAVDAFFAGLQEAHARLPHPCATPSQEQALLLAA